MDNKPKKKTSMVCRILALATVVVVTFVYVNFTASAHDPLWWKHVGLKESTVVPQQQKQQQQQKVTKGGFLAPLVQQQLAAKVIVPLPTAAPLTTPLAPPPTQAALEKKIEPEEIPGLVRGVDYFADYSIRSVKIPEDPVAQPGKPLKFQYMNSSTSATPFYWVSSKPRIAYIPNFLSDEECDNVIKFAEPRLERSQVAIRANDADKNPINEVRTSSQTWLDTNSGPGQPIADKIFKVTGFRPGSSEMMQILRYELNQKYDAHQDYFDPENYGPQPTNRAVTVFLYLSTVEEGGETWFPGADNKPVLTTDYKSCKGGFGFKPRKRDAVIFYDMTPTGGYDPWSLHGGCPVKKGTKWGGTLWLRVPTS